jgi:hypothetical protein
MPQANIARLARRSARARGCVRCRVAEFIERALILIISVGQLHHPLISRTYVADLDRGFPYMITRPAAAGPLARQTIGARSSGVG